MPRASAVASKATASGKMRTAARGGGGGGRHDRGVEGARCRAAHRAFARMGRIERHRDPPRLEYRQRGRHERGRPLDTHADAALRSDTETLELARQLVRAVI